MALLKDMSYETRIGHIRSSGRVNSRVAVAVEWNDAGKKQRAEGHTADISAKGCLAVIPQGFAVGQKVRLFNLTNQNSCEAVLVWRGHAMGFPPLQSRSVHFFPCQSIPYKRRVN